MPSLREFINSIGQDAPVMSVLEIAEHCQSQPPVSVKALIQGDCRQTVSVTLQRQEVGVANFPPYVGELHGNGVLREIAVPNSLSVVGVSFVKAGHSTEDCGDSDAVIFVPEGETIGEAEITEIFDEVPSFNDSKPLFFVACVVATPAFPASVTITITFSSV